MPLNDTQRAFLKKYFASGPSYIDKLDEARVVDGERVVDGPQGDLKAQQISLMTILGTTSIPKDANVAEATEIDRLRKAAIGSMDDPLTPAGLRAAAAMIQNIDEVLISSALRVKTERQDKKDALLKEVTTIEADLDKDPLPGDVLLVTDAVKAIDGLLTGAPPEKDDLVAAELEVGKLRDLVVAANERVKLDRTRRTEAAKLLVKAITEAGSGVDEEAPEREEIIKLASGLAGKVPETPSDLVLEQTKLALDGLVLQATEATKKAVAAREIRIKRRLELIEAVKAVVADAAETEAAALVVKGQAVVSLLPEKVSATDLVAAEKALVAFEDLRKQLIEAVVERKKRVERASTALAAAAWGAGLLKPDTGAPADRIDLLSNEAGALELELKPMTDLAQAHSWGEEKIKKCESDVAALADKVKVLNEFVAAELVKLALAVQKTETAITTTKGAKLVDGQLKGLRLLIEAARKKVADDVSLLATTELELTAIAGRATRLARSLALLDGRITRPSDKPAGALPSELKAIADARKAALDALEKVEP